MSYWGYKEITDKLSTKQLDTKKIEKMTIYGYIKLNLF